MNTFTQTLKGVKNRDVFADLLSKTNKTPTNSMFTPENRRYPRNCGLSPGKLLHHKEAKVIIQLISEL